MEVFGYAIGFFSFIITILVGILTYHAWKNGRWMKSAHEESQGWMKLAHENTQNLIRDTHVETVEIIKKIEQGQAEARRENAEAHKAHEETMRVHEETMRVHEETMRAMQETLGKIHETQKYIANLIVREGEKTRQTIESSLS